MRREAPKMMRSNQVEVAKPSDPSDPSCEILKRDIWSTRLLWTSIGPEAPGGIIGSLFIIWVAKGMPMAMVAKITRVVMTQQHEGVLLQQVELSGMVDCGCPGN